MATTRRPAAMRSLARELEERFGTRFEAEFQSGASWRLSWSLGPLTQTVRDLVDQAAHRLDGAQVEVWRSDGRDRDLALAVIRLAAAGELERGKCWPGPHGIRNQAEYYLRTTAFPERATGREAGMVARLLAAATKPSTYGTGTRLDTDELCTLVGERGVGWLLLPDQNSDQERQNNTDGAAGNAGADGAARPPTRQSKTDELAAYPLERLTARYAEGEAASAWQRFGRTLTAREAVDAALADPDLPDSEVLAVLTLWQQLQAELDDIAKTTAARLAAAVGREAFTYKQIAEVLGVQDRQTAHTWVANRTQKVPQRRSNRHA